MTHVPEQIEKFNRLISHLLQDYFIAGSLSDNYDTITKEWLILYKNSQLVTCVGFIIDLLDDLSTLHENVRVWLRLVV